VEVKYKIQQHHLLLKTNSAYFYHMIFLKKMEVLNGISILKELNNKWNNLVQILKKM
jgi:hypothetical protein